MAWSRTVQAGPDLPRRRRPSPPRFSHHRCGHIPSALAAWSSHSARPSPPIHTHMLLRCSAVILDGWVIVKSAVATANALSVTVAAQTPAANPIAAAAWQPMHRYKARYRLRHRPVAVASLPPLQDTLPPTLHRLRKGWQHAQWQAKNAFNSSKIPVTAQVQSDRQ